MVLKKLNFSYSSDKKLFQDFNFEIKENQITAILGASGCGKSTLLRLLSGLLESTSKSNEPSGEENLRESFIFQESNLLPWKTVEQNIMFPFLFKQNINKSEIQKKYTQVTDQLKLIDIHTKYPHQLSGGQKMRVSIARGLISQPQLLFMDEPFAALDEPTRLEFQDEILRLQSQYKMTILLVTHSFYEACYVANQIVILNKKPSKEVSIVYDQPHVKSFKSRFEDTYVQSVQKITNLYNESIRNA